MHYFNYKHNVLFCENKKISDLAEKFGTPLYVYSNKTILDHFYKIKKAFSSINPLICYSVKANSNLSLLKLLVKNGAGLDIVSGGELYRSRKVKCPPRRIVYASVGKTEKEITDAIKCGILMFNVESLPELEKINQIARRRRKKVNVALRVNPDIDPGTHRYITTGKKETKFGMDINTVKTVFANRSSYSHVNIAGLHIHIGSQITQGAPFIKAIAKMGKLIKDLKSEGKSLKFLNIGGGLGIVYDKEEPQTAAEFAQKVLPLLKGIHLKIILEPGRFIMGNAGILITRVVYIKESGLKRFIVVDAGMNDLLRPSLYGAYHKIVPLIKNSRFKIRNSKLSDVVGPICESGDFLGEGRNLSVSEGDFLVVLGAGAYGFSMSSNYNSRTQPAEVLVNNHRVYLIRRRQSYKDLVDKEIIV